LASADKHRSGAPRRVQSGKPQQSTVPKIKEALNFMKKHSFEVPFIANYRREFVEPELDVHDLWKVLRFDEKVCWHSLCKPTSLLL
jgi:transcription elongation factor SPT6